MSRVMWAKMYRLKIPIPPELPKRAIDDQFEKVTGKECDDAAKTLTDEEFKQAMEKALKQLQEKKKKEKKEEPIAA